MSPFLFTVDVVNVKKEAKFVHIRALHEHVQTVDKLR